MYYNDEKMWSKDTDYLEIVKDLLSHPEVKQLSRFIHHYFTNRLEHSISVSYKSYLIAKKFNLDYRSVARAGLLHDFFLLTSHEVEALGEGSHNNHHPRLALENAKRITTINKIEEDIILKHMFAVSLSTPPKYRESLIVSMIDKYVAVEEVVMPVSKIIKYKMMIAMYSFNY